MSALHIPATSVLAQQRLTLVEHSPDLLDDAGRPIFTVRSFSDHGEFLGAIRRRREDHAFAGHNYLEPREPTVFERTITHITFVPQTLGVGNACLPAAFASGALVPSPQLVTDDIRRRLSALADGAERTARQWENRAGHDTKHRTLARELREHARQLRRTAEMVAAPVAAEAAPETEQASLFG